MQALRQPFSSGEFMPHGYFYLRNSRLVWLHVVSDSLIALAYTWVPMSVVCFGACGATHATEVWALWHSNCWLSGAVQAVTARRDRLDQVTGFAKVTRDVTKRKWAEGSLRKQNEDPARRAIELEASDRELDAFAHSISHELRAPLRSQA